MARIPWKKIGRRSLERRTSKAQGFVFGADGPVCLWAWSVYWRGGHQAWVEASMKRARQKAEECMNQLEETR